MNAALIFSGAALGLASGGHCIAMCGAGSAYFVGSTATSTPRTAALRLGAFHAGRIAGYAFVGALLGGAAAVFHALTEWIALLRPLWTMANTAMFLLGAALLLTARQPLILSTVGQKFGHWFGGSNTGNNTHPVVLHARMSPSNSPLAGQPVVAPGASTRRTHVRGLVTGFSWAFIPCGPLYSAWTLALFAGDPLSGALSAAAFAGMSGLQLGLAQWWFTRFGQGRHGAQAAQGARWDRFGVRVAGAALCLSAGYSIAMLVTGGNAAGWFCL